MDGGRRPHLDAVMNRQAGDAPTAIGQHRCGLCGLLPLPDDQALDADRELCGACAVILKDVDWRRLVNESASAIAD
jgi:hypothetical protein